VFVTTSDFNPILILDTFEWAPFKWATMNSALQKASVFVTSSHFHLSLIFLDKVRSLTLILELIKERSIKLTKNLNKGSVFVTFSHFYQNLIFLGKARSPP